MNDAENSSFPVVALGQIGEGTIQTTNARSLHGFMEIGKDFSTWFKDRVSQYDFTENVDFVLLHNSGEYSGRGQPPKEYAISLDMAKELAMLERNEKGKQVQRYLERTRTRVNSSH